MSGVVEIRELGRPGDRGWVVMAHGEVYAEEFGWDTSFEALVARIVADFDPATGMGWIAELDGRRVGCILAVPGGAPEEAKLRVLLVHPEGRGHGLGGRLLDAALDWARATGRSRAVLWTNDTLDAARALYLARGFERTGREPHRSFGRDLVGETYALALTRRAG